jgi:hypothetical protein
LCAYHKPQVLFNPLRPWFYALLVGFAAVMASGFRTTFLGLAAMLAIGAWLHQGWRGFAMAAITAGLLLAAVLAGQGRLFELPPPIQRSLSFLPGKWSPVVLADAERSSESRFEWWHMIIEEHLIKDWWLGDGFGVSESDFEAVSRTTSAFDWFTLTGSFHNGPLTSIRYAGVVGMLLFYAFMIAAAVYSAKCVRLCRGTSLEPAAIYVALPLLWTPVEFTFIFGSYDLQLPDHILAVALLLLILRMLTKARPTAAVQPSARPMTSEPAVAHISR